MSEEETKKALSNDEIEKVSGGTETLTKPGRDPRLKPIIPGKNKILNPVNPEAMKFVKSRYGNPYCFRPKDITKTTEEKPTETDEKPKI